MLRRLFTFLSAVSLVLCVQAALVWASGDRVTFEYHFEYSGARWHVASAAGEVGVSNFPQVLSDLKADELWYLEYESRRLSASREASDRLRRLRDRLDARERAHRENPRLTVDQDRVYAEQAAEIAALTRELAAAEAAAEAAAAAAAAAESVADAELMAGYPPRRPIATLVERRIVRHGWLVAAFATLPAAWLGAAVARGTRQRRRRAANLCRSCGYDLRATPEKGGALLDRCPECGTVPPEPAGPV